MTPKTSSIPSVSVTYAQDGSSTRSNVLGMRPMAERAYQKRGEQYLLIKAPPASGKSRALMFIALDKLQNQKLKQAIIIVPEKTITNLIAEPDASEGAVTEAVNDTLKAIAASLLMEQVLAPRFEFKPKNPDNGPTPALDYGDGGYDPGKCNVGVNPNTGLIQLEIKGLAEPKSPEAERICREDLTELVTAFVQNKQVIERGLFDEELVPEELTQVRMGKIVKEKFPNLDEEDQEAVRQHAIAALNPVQQAKKALVEGGSEDSENTALIDGVRKFALSVTELDIDLIDRINPFGEAYAMLWP